MKNKKNDKNKPSLFESFFFGEGRDDKESDEKKKESKTDSSQKVYMKVEPEKGQTATTVEEIFAQPESKDSGVYVWPKETTLEKSDKDLGSELNEFISLTENFGSEQKTGQVVYPKVTPYIRKEKLTVLFVENTEAVISNKDLLKQLFKSLVTTGYVCVITYGATPKISDIYEAKEFNSNQVFIESEYSDKACLFDALLALVEIVFRNAFEGTYEMKKKHVKIENIDVVGIGRCIDNCSLISERVALFSFQNETRNTNIKTKYFCLDEGSFVNAAAVGFRSIGSINRNYM